MTTDLYTLSLHDALPIWFERARELYADHWLGFSEVQLHQFLEKGGFREIEVSVVSREEQSPHFQTIFENVGLDRKSTRLNSSHITISYAVFCLKKKNR